MAEREPLQVRVQRFIKKHGLISQREKILVGVSGGPDSVCLLHILTKLRDKLQIELRLAHFDHQLRGVESTADARYVDSLAASLGLVAIIEQGDVRRFRQTHGGSLEEAAREMRYDFLGRAARSWGASRVAVGHTADDQAETILMHLVRGSGLSGLRGMSPLSWWQSPLHPEALLVIRPLLEVTREETEAYCQSQGLTPQLDHSNRLPDYLRNRFRLELIPLLRGFNPNIQKTLRRTAGILAEDYDFLEQQVDLAWKEVVSQAGDSLVLQRQAFARLHPSIQRHLLKKALEYKLGDPQDVATSHVESMLAALRGTGKRVSLLGGLVLWVGSEQAVLGSQPEDFCPLPRLEGEHHLQIPGRTLLPGWRVTTRVMPGHKPKNKSSKYRVYLDMAKAGSNLVVRSRRAGDRLQPLGMSQVKKLQDFLVDARVPQPWRDRTPLLCSPQHILWVVGWRISELAKVSEATENVLEIEFRRS